MLRTLTEEEITSILAEDAGFRSLLQSLPESDQLRIAQILADQSLFTEFLGYLPDSKRLQLEQILTVGMEEADAAFKLFEQSRFFEARDQFIKTLNNYAMPEGLPLDDGVVKAAFFIVVRVQALCHDMLGSIESTLGNTHDAGEHHNHALVLARECGDFDTEAKAHYSLGVHFYEIGDFEQALEHSQRAIEVLKNCADRWSILGKALNSLSLLHAELSQWDEAMKYGERAITELEYRQDFRILPVVLSNRSAQLTLFGAFEEIWPLLERALQIAIERGELRQEALIRHNIGMNHLNCATDTCDVEQGLAQFQEARSISCGVGAIGLQALACRGTGQALIMVDDADGAERELRQSVQLYRSIGSIADCSDTLVELGNTLRFFRNDLSSALECYFEAISLTEQVRSKLKRETHRIGLSEARTGPYQQAITILLEMGRVGDAFHYLERARSKALLELLAGQFITDTSDEVFSKTTELAKRINELRHSLDEIQKADETCSVEEHEGTTRRATMRCDILLGLEQEERQFTRLCEELQQTAPERLGLVATQATDIASVQAILPADTALVEMYQTDEQLLIFVIRSDNSAKVFEVELTADDAEEIVFSYIIALRDPTTLDTKSHDYIRSVRQPASQLYEVIFSDLEEILVGVQRLVIVPHLFWHYLPFHTLFDNKRKRFLFDHYEISYAPSASALVVCRNKKRYKRDSALILSRNDGDLPHVETEGIAISKLFDNYSYFHGSEANLGKVSRQVSPDIIHCACHGYFDPEQPFLSGIAIPPDDEEYRPTLLMDLLQLRMESSLVTLSACDTGLSRISNADELVGLSRGFFGAGATALMLSIWKVSDSSTAHLMEIFYQHYVLHQQTKGKSLQLAMQAVRAKTEYSHPYYWAPFVVMGEWE
jgi:CHAT domain-containing protein